MNINKQAVNLLSLISIQGSAVLLPILVFPYCLHVQGVNVYANIAVSESIMMIVLVFIVYSYDIQGVSEVTSLVQENVAKRLCQYTQLSKVFFKILYIRILILILITIILLIMYLYSRYVIFEYILAWLLFPLSYIFQSSYMFQAMEHNLVPAFIVVGSRLCGVATIFFVLSPSSSIFIVPIIIGVSYVIGGIISLIYAIFFFKLKFTTIDYRDICCSINNGKEIFLSNISVYLLKGVNIIILKFITNNSSVAFYSIAEKIIAMIRGIVTPVNIFFYPKTIRELSRNKLSNVNRDSFRVIWQFTIIQIYLYLFIFIVVIISFVLYIYFFSMSDQVIFLLTICMLPSLIFGLVNFMFGAVGLNYLYAKRYMLIYVLMTGVFSVFTSVLLTYLYGYYGTAISYTLAEMVLFIFILRGYLK
ncbi:oligosaccharide flippase family protein [Francisella sp. TX07-6608]|uniref:oligosaccharide flippase family protein n=1 Tax=Francisella sp. TX07-6608 TaxID=573568 RepID=UPI0008F9D8EA|nr:oligosaccharide flippase family protein [Francisella sp. TX07-6608]OIN84754.1 polysaccharide biosynthesis family protein [Francisella sp. TX07-6608]